MNYYKSRYTGAQIDSLLDKVKEDLVEPATLTNKVEANAAAIEQEATDREKAVSDLNSALTAELDKKVSKVPGKGLSTNDYTDSDKAEVAKVKDKADQTALDGTNRNIEGINTAIEKLVSKEDINTGAFNPTSDSPAGQKSIAEAMEKQNQSLQEKISTNETAISSLETRTKNLEDSKVNVNTGTFDSTSDNPASQKSIHTALMESINNKADKADTYTKTETETAIQTAINSAILTALNTAV